MAWKTKGRTAQRSAEVSRTAPLLAAVVPVIAIVLLAAAAPARTELGLAAVASPLSHEVEDEFEEEGVEEVCEESEEGTEDCEEEGGTEEIDYAPRECLLRSARARVVASASRARLRLIVDYRSSAPADVTVAFFLRGGKGPLSLGQVRRHFSGQAGRLTVSERLERSQVKKARAARSFVVTMVVPRTPRYCRRYNTKRLNVMTYVHGHPVWFQAGDL